MTVPVVSNIHMMEDSVTFEKDVQTAFFLPTEFQTSPLQSYDPDITIVYREPIRVIARSVHHHHRHHHSTDHQINIFSFLSGLISC